MREIRLWELLRDDGHDVTARTVRRLVASFRNAEREATVPRTRATRSRWRRRCWSRKRWVLAKIRNQTFFIYAYPTLNQRPPAEAYMQALFAVTAPTVHQMVPQLERHRLIRRTPRAARSIELLVPSASLPLLERR